MRNYTGPQVSRKSLESAQCVHGIIKITKQESSLNFFPYLIEMLYGPISFNVHKLLLPKDFVRGFKTNLIRRATVISNS